MHFLKHFCNSYILKAHQIIHIICELKVLKIKHLSAPDEQ